MRHFFLLLCFGLVACATPAPVQNAAVAASPAARALVPTFTATPRPSDTPVPAASTPTPAVIPTVLSAQTPTEAPTATPDPYAGLTVADLATRSYGAGGLRTEQTLAVTESFTRTLISYDSDGLTVYGFMNVPRTPPGAQGEATTAQFPVVIVNHGYIDPAVYTTLTYTTRYADGLANAGYVAIHPNFRNYPPSDPGPNEFRVGYAVDVLNLVGLVQRLGGEPGPLARADGESIGLWGHSMGGGVSLRAIAVDSAMAGDARLGIDAAVLYGAMSGDEQRNHERILFFSDGARGSWTGDAPSAVDLARLSPINHLASIKAAVSIHHGALDAQVPLAWSEDLCGRLQALEKAVECFIYAEQPHTFVGAGDALFVQRTVDFFDRALKD